MLIIFLSYIGVKAGDEQSLYIYYKEYEQCCQMCGFVSTCAEFNICAELCGF